MYQTKHVFLSLFNIRAINKWYCDQLDKKQPDSERGRLWVWPRFKLLTPLPWFFIRWKLSFLLPAIPSVCFRSNSFTICRPSPMLVQQMPTPEHGDSDSSSIIILGALQSLFPLNLMMFFPCVLHFKFSVSQQYQIFKKKKILSWHESVASIVGVRTSRPT